MPSLFTERKWPVGLGDCIRTRTATQPSSFQTQRAANTQSHPHLRDQSFKMSGEPEQKAQDPAAHEQMMDAE